MSHLELLPDEALVERWEEVFPKYKNSVQRFESLMKEMAEYHEELSLIREELVKRDIKLDGV